MPFVTAASRIDTLIKCLAFQGMLLFILVLLNAGHASLAGTILLSLETLSLKTIIIPLLLLWIVRKNGINSVKTSANSKYLALLTATLLFAGGFLLSYLVQRSGLKINALYFGISVSTLVLGLFIILTRKEIFTQVMGFLFLENAVFLLLLSVFQDMRVIAALVFPLDLFAAAFLYGLYVTKKVLL